MKNLFVREKDIFSSREGFDKEEEELRFERSHMRARENSIEETRYFRRKIRKKVGDNLTEEGRKDCDSAAANSFRG